MPATVTMTVLFHESKEDWLREGARGTVGVSFSHRGRKFFGSAYGTNISEAARICVLAQVREPGEVSGVKCYWPNGQQFGPFTVRVELAAVVLNLRQGDTA